MCNRDGAGGLLVGLVSDWGERVRARSSTLRRVSRVWRGTAVVVAKR